MNQKGINKSKKRGKTMFAEVLSKSPLSLKEVERRSRVNYTTLTDLKWGRITCKERTLMPIAACFGMTPAELFPQKEMKYNTPFAKICREKNLDVEKVHGGTGLSRSILNNLHRGVQKTISNRTKRDLLDFLEVPEEVLFPAKGKRGQG